MLENPLSNEFQLKQNKTQAKILLFTIIPHTILWWSLEIYSNQAYIVTIIVCLLLAFMFFLMMIRPSLGQSFKAVLVGLIPVFLFASVPKFALFALGLNFTNLGLAFFDMPLSKLPLFLLSNGLGWVACYQFLDVSGSEGEELVRILFKDENNIFQLKLNVFVSLFILLSMVRKKYVETKIQEQSREALIQLNKELEIANDSLKKTNNQLQLALQEKENFILRFSHEIRNPLNSLLGNIELCFESTEDKELKSMLMDAKVSGEILLQLLNNVLDTAKVAAGRLEVSINPQNIRDFMQRAWVICSEIIRKNRLYGCLSVNLDVPEVLEFDHHRVMQILINTVSNAAKFTEAGYVKIFVDFIKGRDYREEDLKPKHPTFIDDHSNEEEKENLHCFTLEDVHENPKDKYEHLTFGNKKFTIDRKSFVKHFQDSIEVPSISPQKRGVINSENQERGLGRSSIRRIRKTNSEVESVSEGFIRFEIVDSGCGIQKEDLVTLFERFKQVNIDSSKRKIGTGLGLWITKEIIELMDGKIEIHSKPKKGTTLVIVVKSRTFSSEMFLEPEASIYQFQPSLPATLLKTSKRALVVEDSSYNQEVNRKFLEKCNVQEISIASNGKEAVDLFEKMGPNYYDLILMDIDMPVMDGKLATKTIRKIEEDRGWVPSFIVFLTAYAEAKTQRELLDQEGEYRANKFIAKPASFEVMQNIMKECSSKSAETISGGKTEQIAQRSKEINVVLERKTVLVVDGDVYNLDLLAHALERWGFAVLRATNGEMALELYHQNWNKIQYVLVDIELSGMDGLQVTKKIVAKYNKITSLCGREIVIYGFTGNNNLENKQQYLEAGMKDVLVRPVSLEDLRILLMCSTNKKDRHED